MADINHPAHPSRPEPPPVEQDQEIETPVAGRTWDVDESGALAYAEAAHYVFEDHGTDTVVVLLHGLGGDHLQPLGLTPDALRSTSLSVLAPDARAHGQTMLIGPPERFTNQALAEDVLALVDRLGLHHKQLILIGISMGAAVALELARHHADRLAGVILIRPSFEASPWPPHLLVFRDIASLLRAEGPRGASAFRRGLSYQEMRLESESASASLVEQFAKPRAVDRVVRLETVPGNVSIDWDGELVLACPVTVVAALKDPGHPVHVAELWYQRLQGSTLVRVPSRDERPTQYQDGLAQIVTTRVQAWR